MLSINDTFLIIISFGNRYWNRLNNDIESNWLEIYDYSIEILYDVNTVQYSFRFSLHTVPIAEQQLYYGAAKLISLINRTIICSNNLGHYA
jgi:hypothetical protein